MAFGGSTSAGVGDESVPTRTLCAPLVGARTAGHGGALAVSDAPGGSQRSLDRTLPAGARPCRPLSPFGIPPWHRSRCSRQRLRRPPDSRWHGHGRCIRVVRVPAVAARCAHTPGAWKAVFLLPAARGRRAMWLSGAAWSDSDGDRAKGDALNWRGRRHCSHDHPCVLPGTSAPRSTSSRSATLTVRAFSFTSHQYAAASSSFQALLSSRSRPVHQTSRKHHASVSLGHSARSGRSASISSIHSSSVTVRLRSLRWLRR